MVNSKYKGNDYFAIVKHGNFHEVQYTNSRDILSEKLVFLASFSPSFKVVKRFDDVKFGCWDMLEKAVKRLNKGERVKLEELLN